MRSKGGAVGLKLGAASVKAPKGAIRKGETLTLTQGATKKFPGSGAASLVGGAYEISTSQGEPSKPVEITFHYRPGALASGERPLVLHGWSAFGDWVPEPTKVDGAKQTVSAELTSFSPIDVVGDITWAAGDITGDRTDLPSGCGPAPSWVEPTSFPFDRNDSLPACIGAESDARTLYIHIANNRGYAQFITVSNATVNVSRSHWSDSLEGLFAQQLAAHSRVDTPSSFVLAPGSHATVAIDRPPITFGNTAVSLVSAPKGASAAAEMGWALLNKVAKEFGKRVDIADCVISDVHNTLASPPSATSTVAELHACASAASSKLKGAAKDAFAKITSALLVTSFFYKLIDLATDEAYPPEISFTIPGRSPTNPDIHVANLSFGSLSAGRRTVVHLTAGGGTAPYTFHVSHAATNTADVPPWAQLDPDGTLTIDPPVGTNQDVGFFVYATDATGQSSPFARDRVNFSVSNSSDSLPWSSVELPVPTGGEAGSGAFNLPGGPVCTSSGSCVAVGTYVTPAGGNRPSMLLTMDGQTGVWSSIEAPVPAGGQPGSAQSFSGPACSTGGVCFDAGEYLDSMGGYRGLLETFAGGSWSTGPIPIPAGSREGSGWLQKLTCPADFCVASGRYVTADGEEKGLVDTFANGAWTIAAAPRPVQSATSPDYRTFACSAPGTCAALGYNSTNWLDGEEYDLIYTHSGGTWAATPPPVPAGGEAGSGRLDLLACPASGSCVAVGFYREPGGERIGMTETLANGVWTPSKVPVPEGDGPGFFDLLSCGAAGTCGAFGTYPNPGGGSSRMFATFANGVWTAVKAPAPPAAVGLIYIETLECPAPGECVAVGSYLDAAIDEHRDLIETYRGGSWTATEAPLPPDGKAASGDLIGWTLGCAVGGPCAVLGEYEVPGGGYRGLIETFVDGAWRPTTAPLPSGGVSIHWGSPQATCATSGTCVAIGYYEGGDGEIRGLINTLRMAP